MFFKNNTGPVWASGGQTQTFYLQPMTQTTYAADNNSTVLADWGQSQLARASGQTMGQGLSLNHLYINGLQFSLSYLS